MKPKLVLTGRRFEGRIRGGQLLFRDAPEGYYYLIPIDGWSYEYRVQYQTEPSK